MSTSSSILENTRRTLEMIKFEHSVFALPFAFLGALLAAGGIPAVRVLLWIVVAMIGARSAAMTFNRIADRGIDARNPRTASRALPAGRLTTRFAWGFFVASCLVFEIAAWKLNRMAFALAPVALAWICLYSYTKRFTSLSHLVLGTALGIAPAAAWIAVRGSLSWRILPLTAAVTLWVAGFDVLYACQDYEFDVAESALHSIPKRLGIGNALRIAAASHIAVVAILVWMLSMFRLGPIAWMGLVAVAALLWYEHSLLAPHDLSRINSAFFTVNGYIGILLLISWGAAIVLRGSAWSAWPH